MELFKDRRFQAAAGVVAALVAGVIVAYALGAGKKGPATPPPASQGGLVVEVGHDDAKLDPSRKLPCYVGGQSVGMTTLAECAGRNGISSGQLDVGIAPSGEMAYGEAGGGALAPLPPAEVAAVAPAVPAAPVASQTTAASPAPPTTAACWRYAERTWLKMSDMPLSACVAALFDGHCERPGGATYGRWGDQTLRLVPGRVEQSADNRSFRTLVEQGSNCTLPQ